MGILDYFTNTEKKDDTNIYLNENMGAAMSGGTRETAPTTDLFLERINPILLEGLYHQDEIIFSAINLLSSVFLSAEYTVKASNDEEKEITLQWLDEIDFGFILQKTIQDMGIYGYCWYEKLYNSNGKLVNVATLDSKTFDVRRNTKRKPIYNEDGEFQSYVQYIDSDMTPPNEQAVVQQNDLWGNFYKAIELEKKNMVYIPYYSVGKDPLGVGLIEPIYNVTKSKQTIRQGITQSTQRMGFPLIGFKVCDKDHHPTPDQLTDLYTKVRDINERTTFVHAHFIEPYILENKQAGVMHEHLNHYEDAQIAALGMPKSLVTGQGEETNRATLERQIYIWEKKMRFTQGRITHAWTHQILKEFAEQHGFESTPEIVFEDISTESIFGRVERWADLAKVGLISPDQPLEEYIRDMENLPKPVMEEVDDTSDSNEE